MSSVKTFSPISKFFSPKGRSKGVKKLKEFKSEQPTPEIEQDTQETNVSHLSTELEAIATTKLKEVKSEQPTPEIEQDTQETNVSHLSTELEAIATTSPIKTENIFNEKPDVTLEKDEKENIPPVEVKSPRKMFLSPIFLKKPKSKASDPDYKPKKSKKKKKKEQPVDKKQPLISSFLRRSTRVPTGEKRKIDQQVLEQNLSVTDDSTLKALKIKTTDEKGRGVYAAEPIGKGSFVVEYAGDLVSMDEGVKREEDYSEDARIGSYIFFFNFKGKRFCLDATAESGRYGRLLNHSRLKPNCKTRLVEYPEGTPRLIIEAKRDIITDEELLYDYGDRSAKALKAHPWLKT